MTPFIPKPMEDKIYGYKIPSNCFKGYFFRLPKQIHWWFILAPFRTFWVEGFYHAWILFRFLSFIRSKTKVLPAWISCCSVLHLFLHLCKELQDICGFTKIPDATLISCLYRTYLSVDWFFSSADSYLLHLRD